MILVLNTIYWNVDAYKRGPNITLIGNIQMMWLEKQLLAAKQVLQSDHSWSHTSRVRQILILNFFNFLIMNQFY